MKERIRATFTVLEKQKIAQAILQHMSKTNDGNYKDAFFAVQSNVLRHTRTITEDKWPSVQKWVIETAQLWMDMEHSIRQEVNQLIAQKDKELKEAALVNSSISGINKRLENEITNLNKQLFAFQKAKSKISKPKVVIAGLLHSQERIIKERHDNAFRLSFVTSDQYSNGQMSDRMRNADKVVLMTDFISHNSFQATLGDKAILVKGGMSSLHRVLSDLVI